MSAEKNHKFWTQWGEVERELLMANYEALQAGVSLEGEDVFEVHRAKIGAGDPQKDRYPDFEPLLKLRALYLQQKEPKKPLYNLDFLARFEYLEQVDASGCAAVEIQLPSGSKLKYLQLNNCPKLRRFEATFGQLEQLDIANCPDLEAVVCSSNKLKRINLSQSPNLKLLQCDRNNLWELNLVGYRHLSSLNCRNNQIYRLDLSNCVSLGMPVLQNNPLTELVMHNCLAINKLDLSQIVDTLIKLDLTGCANLQYFSSVGYNASLLELILVDCVALEEIYGQSGKLEKLNLQNCRALRQLRCDKNRLSELNLSYCTALETLICNRNLLTTLDLSKCVGLQKLICSRNKICTLNLANTRQLLQLNCEQNELEKLHIADCVMLEKLNCDQNKINQLHFVQNKVLQQVSCAYNNLQILILKDLSELQSINCHHNQLRLINIANSPKVMTLSFLDNPVLRILGLADSKLRDKNKLIEQFEQDLQKIQQPKNWVRAEQLLLHINHAFSQSKKTIPITFFWLNTAQLYHYVFGQDSLLDFLIFRLRLWSQDYFKLNLKATFLSLNNCNKADKLSSMDSFLFFHPNITALDCCFNALKSLIGIFRAPYLRYLDCSFNQITDITELVTCAELEHFICDHNPIENIEILQYCVSLRRFHAVSTNISSLAALYELPHLEMLILGDNPHLREEEIYYFSLHLPSCHIYISE